MDDDFLARFRERSAYETARGSGRPTASRSCPTCPSAATPTRRSRSSSTSTCSSGSGSTPPTSPSSRRPAATSSATSSARRSSWPGTTTVRSGRSTTPAATAARRSSGCSAGQARMLVCQFHSWSYDLRGSWCGCPDERDFVGLQKEERCLPVRALRAVGRLVLRQPRPRRDAAGRVARPAARPAARGGGRAVPDDRHQERRAGLQLEDPGRGLPRGVPRPDDPPEDRRAVARHQGHRHHPLRPRPPEHAVAGQRGAPGPTTASGCRSSRARRRSSCSDIQPAHGIFPNLITPLDARGFPFLVFWPLAIDRTRLDIIWFAADWGEGRSPRSTRPSGSTA